METEYTITGLHTGWTYRLRYRVLNAIGWSDYSPVLTVLVASVSSQPPAVTLIAATDTSITLSFGESASNGGSKVLSY